MALPHEAQKQMPVSRVGPLTMRGAVQCRAAGLEQCLHLLELSRLDNRRHRHFHDFALRLTLPCLPEPGVEAVPTNIGGAAQHLVDGANAPASPVARTDAGRVEVGRDMEPLCDPAPLAPSYYARSAAT